MPPQHSVSAAIRVISSTDPAWDHERIDREYAPMKAAGHEERHPYIAYILGDTRYDLDAPVQFPGGEASPRSYLKAEARPLTWVMRRLKITELARCEDVGGNEGRLIAFRLALVGVENPPPEMQLPELSPNHPMREGVVDGLVELVGADAVFAAGAAAMKASAAPTSAEKKR